MSQPAAKQVLELFLLSIEEIGIESTALALRQNLDRNAWLSHPDGLFVLRIVAQTFQIPVEEIRSGVTRKNDRRDAIGFCAFLLLKEFNYSVEQIGWMLNRSPWIVYKHALVVKKLRQDQEADRKYLNWKKLFCSKIEKYKKTKSLNNVSHELNT